MGMPPKSASLSYNGVVINIALSSLYRALSYICWSISPSTSKLSNSMPVINENIDRNSDHVFAISGTLQKMKTKNAYVYQ